MEKIREIEKRQLKADLPSFGAGDTVKVHIRVKEGKRERIQIFILEAGNRVYTNGAAVKVMSE